MLKIAAAAQVLNVYVILKPNRVFNTHRVKNGLITKIATINNANPVILNTGTIVVLKKSFFIKNSSNIEIAHYQTYNTPTNQRAK
jgi:hypothetical protein